MNLGPVRTSTLTPVCGSAALSPRPGLHAGDHEPVLLHGRGGGPRRGTVAGGGWGRFAGAWGGVSILGGGRDQSASLGMGKQKKHNNTYKFPIFRSHDQVVWQPCRRATPGGTPPSVDPYGTQEDPPLPSPPVRNRQHGGGGFCT